MAVTVVRHTHIRVSWFHPHSSDGGDDGDDGDGDDDDDDDDM
jgi:hypothetical protein